MHISLKAFVLFVSFVVELPDLGSYKPLEPQ